MIADNGDTQHNLNYIISPLYNLNIMTRKDVIEGQTRALGITLVIVQLALCLLYGFFTSSRAPSIMHADDNYVLLAMFMVALVGFSLMYTYIRSMSVMVYVQLVLMFGLSFQLYFLLMGLWQKLNITEQVPLEHYQLPDLSLTHNLIDRQETQQLNDLAISGYIPCYLCLVVAFGSFIGRVGHIEILFVSLIGTIAYTVNAQLFWNYFIVDCGYTMRTFLLGGVMGVFSGILLWGRTTTRDHTKYVSVYFIQKLSLVGSMIVWCMFPSLNLSSLHHNASVGHDNLIIHASTVNMYMALCGSVIGAVCACIALHRKLSVFEFIFTSFSGGIAFGCMADLTFNPGIALGVGTGTGFVCALLHGVLVRRINQKGVLDCFGTITAFLLPALLGGIGSAITQALGARSLGAYPANLDNGRNNFEAGGYQMAGVGLSIALGLGGGLVLGFFNMFFNAKRQRPQQFNPKRYIHLGPFIAPHQQ